MKVRIKISRQWPALPSAAPLIGLAILQLTAIANPPIQQAWKLADAARDMARAGAVEEALDGYRAAMDVAPAITEIRRDYATALGWAGQWEEASRQFSNVFELQPEQPNWAVPEMANAHFFGGNDEGALIGFDMLIARGEVEEATLTRRGLTLLRLQRSEEAEQQYREALAYYPDSELAAVGIVRAMLQQGRPRSPGAQRLKRIPKYARGRRTFLPFSAAMTKRSGSTTSFRQRGSSNTRSPRAARPPAKMPRGVLRGRAGWVRMSLLSFPRPALHWKPAATTSAASPSPVKASSPRASRSWNWL